MTPEELASAEAVACRGTPVEPDGFNANALIPYGCTTKHISSAMSDFVSFLGYVNEALASKSIQRLESFLMPANFSSMVGEFMGAAIPKYCSTIVKNKYHNGHPDLIPTKVFPEDSILHATEGIEIKASRHTSGWQGHNPENVWLLVFVFDSNTARDSAQGDVGAGFTVIRRGIFHTALVVGPSARAYRCFMPTGNSKGNDRRLFYGLGRGYQPKSLKLGRCCNTAGGSSKDGNGRKTRFVFAFVVRGAGNAGCSRGCGVSPCPFTKPAGEVFGIGGIIQSGYGNPCLVIAWARLKRQKSGLPYPTQRCLVEVIELHKLRFAAVRPDNDVIAPCLGSRKEFRQGVLELRYGLLRSESALFTIDVDMRQVKVSNPHAGECIEHLVCSVEIRHSSSPCMVGLL
jgi:hypothetical protein